jgi:predicted PurR-regulated permease PerM
MTFILLEAAGLPEKLQAAFGWEKEHMTRLSKARQEVQRYLGIKTLISTVTGVVIFLWVWLLGVDFPVVWGLLAFFLNYIPNLGSILAALPAVLLAGIELGLGRALLVALGYVTVNLVLGNFVDPYLMGRRLGLSTLVVFLSLLFWGWVWGPVGMLLSVPLTMMLKIVLENTRDFRWLAHLLGPTPKPDLAPLG